MKHGASPDIGIAGADELTTDGPTGVFAIAASKHPGRGDGLASPAVVATAGVVHDLGNLIQIASSAINLVVRNPDVPVIQCGPMLKRANSSLESAGDLVRQSIRLIRDRSIAGESCSVDACLAEVTALVDHMADSGFSVELDVEPDLPEVRCNPLGLKSAILNLVFNARDAMVGAGTVLIEAEAVKESLSTVELRVIDSGVGMARETIDRAFDPFFTTKADGLGGIGLPMVAQFVRNCGGEVSVDSEPGVGTTVALRLPTISTVPHCLAKDHYCHD